MLAGIALGDRHFGALHLGTEVLVPTSFLPWWDNAAQRRAFDLIRGLIEILVPFTSAGCRFRDPTGKRIDEKGDRREGADAYPNQPAH